MTPQSPSKLAPWGFTQFSQSPSPAPSYFPESCGCSEISAISKVFLVLGKAISLRAPNLGCRGLSHLCDLMLHQNLCLRCDALAGALLWWSCRSPVALSCSLLNNLNSFCGGMLKLNAKFDADLLLYLLSHFACDGHMAHTLTQWHLLSPLTGTVKSSLFMQRIPVLSPWLPGYSKPLSCKLSWSD